MYLENKQKFRVRFFNLTRMWYCCSSTRERSDQQRAAVRSLSFICLLPCQDGGGTATDCHTAGRLPPHLLPHARSPELQCLPYTPWLPVAQHYCCTGIPHTSYDNV